MTVNKHTKKYLTKSRRLNKERFIFTACIWLCTLIYTHLRALLSQFSFRQVVNLLCILHFRHLVAVVKAWVEISDSDSDSDDEQQQKTISAHSTRESSADRHELWAPQSPLRIHMPDTGHVIVRPYNQDEVKRLRNVFSGSARFIGKLQQKRTRSKFQFEKYITYLEKVSRNVGFSIGVVLVTWDLVSTVFFFLISLIALFVQESIFGKTKSTISI